MARNPKLAIEVEIKNIKKIADLKNELKQLRKEQKKQEAESKSGRLQSHKDGKAYKDRAKAIKENSKSLRTLNKDMAGATKATKSATKSNNGMAKQFITGAAAIGMAVTAFRTITKIISSSIETFKNFEFQMAKVKAITGASEKDFKKLSNTAQQLGRSTFYTASQVAELQVAFGKLGFSTTEILAAQEATLQLATATQTDLARAAVVAGAAVRGFALDASETQRVVDVMAVAFTSSALDIEKFQTSMTKVAPIAAAADISLESTTAVMGTLTDAGIEASIAGTSLRNIFLKMQDPASDLSRHLGFTVENTDDLEKALTQLNDEGLSNAEMMELVDLRQVAAFQTMVNGTASILSLTDALEDSNGEAQKMADIMADTLEGDILKAKSAYEGFELSVLGGNNKISRSIRLVVQEFTSFFSILTDNMRSSEQLGADFLTQSLKNVQAIENAGKAVQKVQKDNNIILKTRAELLQEEIDKQKGAIRAGAVFTASMKEQYKDLSRIDKDRTDIRLKDIERQRPARELAIKDLTEILEIEVKAEKNKNDLLSIETDIRLEKEKRAKNKKDAQGKADAEKSAQEAFNNEKARIDREARELNNIQKELLINEQITQETYDSMAFDAEQQRLQDQVDLYIKYQEDTSVINGQMLSNKLKMIADEAAAEAKAAKQKENDNIKEQKDREDSINSMKEIGNQLILIAGEEEELQELKRLGIKLSQAAAIAAGFEAMAKYGAAIADTALNSPWWLKIINVVGLIGAMASTYSNIKALSGGKMAEGGMIEEFADGGMVHGASHANGGVKFAVGGRVNELEGGEAVINKRSTAMFRNQLSSMNEAGGGVKFADGGLMSSPSFTEAQFGANNQSAMMGAMGGQRKVVVVEADITDSQSTVSVIQANATF